MAHPIIIAGAGIGGLSAALALNARGHDVLVVERTAKLAEVGAGLQLSPNACRVLSGLGVLERLLETGVQPESLRIMSARNGSEIARLASGEQMTARYGAPYLVVHRADLQQALFDEAETRPGISFRFNSEILDSDDAPEDGLRCRIRVGSDFETVTAKALIGADGVWSKTRKKIPGHAEAKYSGLTAYRATLPASELPADLLTYTGLWIGPNAHLVHYPIRSGQEFNLVGLIPERWTEEGWSAKANRDQFLHHYKKWPSELKQLLEKPKSWLKWALCGVDANGPWSNGKIVLLGDAAHAMLPFAAQGAAMAIEDAAVLAALFPPWATDIANVFKAYEETRKPRVAKIQKTASENGRIYHLNGPMAIGRDAVMKLMGPEKLAARQDWIYGWQPGD